MWLFLSLNKSFNFFAFSELKRKREEHKKGSSGFSYANILYFKQTAPETG
jgi:hypothetical protein